MHTLRPLRRLLLAGLCVALLLPAGTLHAKSLEIQRFGAEILVRRNGAFEVTERLQVRFDGEWNGIFRDLNLQHTTAGGKRARLAIEVLSVSDEDGQPLRYESSREGGSRRLKIWVPGAQNATRTVVLRYRVEGGLRFFAETQPEGLLDELYWQVTGTEWEWPIREASVRVLLPAGAVVRQAAAYVGTAGSSAQVPVERVGDEQIFARTDRPLHPGEGLTVAVGWPGGVVARPSAVERAGSQLAALWPLLLPLLAFWGMLRHWQRHGKDPTPYAITVQYAPPADLSPAELGTLVDNTADMRDLTATLVDLAVRGYLIIEEREEKKLLGLVSSREYIFHAARPMGEWAELRPHEQRFMSALFAQAQPAVLPAGGGSGDRPTFGTVELSDLTNKFYTELSGIRDRIYEGLVGRGYYLRRPDRARALYVGAGLVPGIAGIFAAIFVAETGLLGLDPVAVGLGLGLSSLCLVAFGWFMPARTAQGARVQEAALGFREFLNKVEADRFKRMITSPELFERYLPYAMAFNVEQRWARAFEDLYTTPPTWYHGSSTTGFHTGAFVDSLGRMSTEAASTLASSPSSSGSGGGGSVGGGSGGGGGGGF